MFSLTVYGHNILLVSRINVSVLPTHSKPYLSLLSGNEHTYQG